MTSYDIGVTYEQNATNYTCPTAPPTATITGVTGSFISGFTCKTITWSSTVTGGTPGYTYTWYRDGYQVGTSSSYSETFCGDNYTWTEYVNLSLTVSDAANQTGRIPTRPTSTTPARPLTAEPVLPAYRVIFSPPTSRRGGSGPPPPFLINLSASTTHRSTRSRPVYRQRREDRILGRDRFRRSRPFLFAVRSPVMIL